MVRQRKPVNSSSRFQSYIDYREELSGHKPYKKLLKRIPNKAGRNNQGRICVRHQGSGNKRLYRMIDWKRLVKNIPGVIESVEYDPFRTSFVSLVKFKGGARSYQIAIHKAPVGSEVECSENAEIKPGNSLPLKSIPSGTQVCCVELKPGAGSVLVRSAGASAVVVGHVGNKAQVSMPSGEVRQIPDLCWATIGVVSNADHANLSIGKAGRNRHLGIRPSVRGVAMNPVDHPMGGGEGKARGSKHPRSPWGWKTKGYRTRKAKASDRDIITSRHKKVRGR
jgi:large subunit ribosomal protein L2